MTSAPGSSKPKYPIPWISTYFIAGLVLIVGSFAVLWYVNQFSSDYDYYDPDMTFLERIVLSSSPGKGDFTQLNGGDWQALCLVGWQGKLAKFIVDAKLPPARVQKFLAKHDALAGDMDKSEFILIYLDKSGAVKALLHPHGFAFAREGQGVCTTTSKPALQLPGGSPH